MKKNVDFDFYPYLVENAEELSKFSRDVNILSASALTQLQRLPVTLRRRAASHNVKRLPFRFRAMATVSVAKKVVRKCRKYRRRHMNVREIFASRQIKNKWLCTHIWHAKRFRMENKWGWRLPMVPNLKTFRPCTKAMSQGCCVIDISYFESFELCGYLTTDVLTSLRSLLDRSEADNILQRLQSGLEVSCVLHGANEFPYGAICPLKMVRLADHSTLISWHPAARSQVVTTLTSCFGLTEKGVGCWADEGNVVVLVDRGGDLCRFRLLGHGSHGVLTTILGDCEQSVCLSSQRLVQVPAGFGVEALVSNPARCRPILKQTDLVAVWPTKGIKKPLAQLVSSTSFFQVEKNILTEKLSGDIKNDPLKHLQPIEEGEKCPLRVMRHSHSGNTPGGWDVLVPCKWAMQLWTTLIMKGCRPTGLRYWSRYCAVEASSLTAKSECYPSLLWPDTTQGALEAQQRSDNLGAAWKRRPPAKRVNHALQATAHPFRCPYESLGARLYVCRDRQLLQRVADPLLQGRRSASVADLDAHDHDLRNALLPVTVACLGPAVRPFASLHRSVASDDRHSALEQVPGEATLRPIVGFVEEADQSMLTGRARGCGFVSLLRLLEDGPPRGHGNLYWAKNPNERRLIPVTLSALQ